MRRIALLSLTLCFAAFAQSATPSLYINGGNLTLQSNGVAVAGLQFNVPSTTGVVLNTAVTNKQLFCGAATCIIASPNNAAAIADGPLVNIAALPTSVIAVTPTGVSQPVSLISNPCDVNKDGKIDVTDFSTIVTFANGSAAGTADINGDGKTDIFDVFRVLLAILNGGACKVGP